MIRLLFLIVILIASEAKAQFHARMENVKSGNKEIYDVYATKDQYRYEFMQDGQKKIVIVKPEANETLILIPEKKFFIQEACNGMISRENDPVQAYASMKKHFTEKDAGKENMAGYQCVKKELFADNDKIITVWYAEALKFPVKMINHVNKGTYMNLTEIKKWDPDPNLFSVPNGFMQVDERMRPVIPEPPAPGKWTLKTVQIPFHDQVSRGTELVFIINKEAHYKLIGENKTGKPAKIIRYSFRDGKMLPEKIQGPEKYRTLRLYPKEKISETLILKQGSEIHIKVFEGTMYLDIHSE